MAQRTGPLEKTTQARGPLNLVLHVWACLFFLSHLKGWMTGCPTLFISFF